MPPISDPASLFEKLGLTSYFLAEATAGFISSTPPVDLRPPVDLGPVPVGSGFQTSSVMKAAALNREMAAGPSTFSPTLRARFIPVRGGESTIGRVWGNEAVRAGSSSAWNLSWRNSFVIRQNEALIEYSALRRTGNSFNRTMVAAFFLELGWMGFRRIHEGSAKYELENRLYQIADQRQSSSRSAALSFLKGAADLIAPSISARIFVDSRYVEAARADWEDRLAKESEELKRYLLSFLGNGIPGDTEEADFQRRIDWSPLRGEASHDYYQAKGGKLEIEWVAEVLADPKLQRKLAECPNRSSQNRYLREQFRGYQLEESDVATVFAWVALFQARKRIVVLKSADPSGQIPLLRHFDESGRLKVGQEAELLRDLLDLPHLRYGLAELEGLVLEMRRAASPLAESKQSMPHQDPFRRLFVKPSDAELVRGILRYRPN